MPIALLLLWLLLLLLMMMITLIPNLLSYLRLAAQCHSIKCLEGIGFGSAGILIP